ncbi:CHAT domain-containing protein [Actinocorallia libanotica]|uniref:CHAT domain-containing protein n=1 Tax=Actinocorallia libanotica TaxID=46162 RepID=A0ABN1Q492_9ACTN
MSDEYDEITTWADPQRVKDIIRHYDADFDVPFRHGLALGIFRIADAYASDEAAVRLGAYWCDIVRADVEYDLLDGLRLKDLSLGDAERLRDACRSGGIPRGDTFTPYVTARWFNATGKILYRLGSYGRAWINLETAYSLARDHGLWWCLPDLQSDFLRADFEERHQTSGAELARRSLLDLIGELEKAGKETLEEARRRGIAFGEPAPEEAQDREFMRGYSNLLHNLAITLNQAGDDEASLRSSSESIAVSRALGDGYRIGQSLTHKARLLPPEEKEQERKLFEELSEGAWRRGRRIARQQLARLTSGLDGIRKLRALLSELDGETVTGGTGMDIGFYDYAVQIYTGMVRGVADEVPPEEYAELQEDVARRRLAMARSVRSVVAIPAYKRAYTRAVRPAYLERIAALLQEETTASGVRHVQEEAFGLVEETSARELLDLLSSSSLPLLGPPDSPPPPPPAASPPSRRPVGGIRRRGALRRTAPEEEEQFRKTLSSREAEFESQFLRRPLETAPHDPEIAHQVRMYTVNNPGTCVVRYFLQGQAGDPRLGAFVFRGGDRLDRVDVASYREVEEFARAFSLRLENAEEDEQAPTEEESVLLWELLIAPVWDRAVAKGLPEHLVLIPVDEMFSLPLHVAAPAGEGLRPLAVRVPMSQSVSATAFVSRGRHLLRRQPVEADDDLAAVIASGPGDEDMELGQELVGTGWGSDHVLVAGTPPPGLTGARVHAADWAGIAALSETRPEFFVYAGHGEYQSSYGELGPFLRLPEDILTSYDVALRLRLPRNKLSVIGACLAGQGAQRGGDVSGFLRAFIAAGAGAIGLPLWSVQDPAMVATTRSLLAASRAALAEPGSAFDVVQALHRIYRREARASSDFTGLVEKLTLSLYL